MFWKHKTIWKSDNSTFRQVTKIWRIIIKIKKYKANYWIKIISDKIVE